MYFLIDLSREDRKVLLLAGAVMLAGSACSTEPEPTEDPVCEALRWEGSREGTSVVLIVSDTMRRDRMAIHGGPARTPNFDRFARENLLFDRAFTQAPWTKPSMATLFTSLYPSQHGVLSHPEVDRAGASDPGRAPAATEALSRGLVTWAEILQAGGYRTAAFVSNPWMERRFGFDQGFDVYDDSFAAWDLPGEQVSRAGLRWLERLESGQPFLLYLHYMDSHRPYPSLSRWDILERAEQIFGDAPALAPHIETAISGLVSLDEGLSVEAAGLRPTLALLEAAYDSGVERFDDALAVFLSSFARHEAYERTAVIVTSDHGEALFTRGYDNHGNGLYDDEVAIPFAARLPGVSAPDGPIDCPLGLIDVLPTLCSYLDLDCPDDLFGTSLLEDAGRGTKSGAAYVLTEGVAGKPQNRAIRDRNHKLILQPQRGYDGTSDLLFDLNEDPGETRNLLRADLRTRQIEQVYASLSSAAQAAVPAYAAPEGETVPLDPQLEERLRALGYVD